MEKQMSEKIEEILKYIEASEFGNVGTVDKSDSWYPLYALLEDFWGKVKDNEHFNNK